MLRWTRSIFCVVSLIVFLLSVSLWVRSYFATADVERFSRQTEATQQPPLTRTLGYGIGWARGQLGLFHYRGESSVPATSVRTWIYREFEPERKLITPASPCDRVNLQFGSFQLLYRVERGADGWLALRLVIVPFWVFPIATIPPVVGWRIWRRGPSREKRQVQPKPRNTSTRTAKD